MKNVILKLSITFCLIVSQILTAQCKKEIFAGTNHTLVLDDEGKLWLCGRNKTGQLGDGTIESKKQLQKIDNQNWKAISAGVYHTVAIKSDGTLWAWGGNLSAQLGDGSTENKLKPVQVGKDANWKAISAGENHTLALKDNGSLWVWGNNAYGQLGNGTTIKRSEIPLQVGTDTNWKDISAGGSHNLALKDDGSLWSWGYNYRGQLGVDSAEKTIRTVTRIGTETNWKQISAGYNHSLAIRNDGTLWSWGKNNKGELGDGTAVSRKKPVQVGEETNWLQVSAGWDFSTALKKDKTLWAFGDNNKGQLGADIKKIPLSKNPVQVGKAANWEKISAGGEHVMVLNNESLLFTWGANDEGQLADDTFINKNSPNPIGEACKQLDVITFERMKTSIYPNPTDAEITIRFEEPVTAAKITLWNSQGQLIIQKNSTKNEVETVTLPINGASGIYYVTIEFPDGKKAYYKIIKN